MLIGRTLYDSASGFGILRCLSLRVLLSRQHSKNRPAASGISAPGKASDLQLAKAPSLPNPVLFLSPTGNLVSIFRMY